MELKSKCCRKYRSKTKACKRCPVVALMSDKKRQKFLKKARKK